MGSLKTEFIKNGDGAEGDTHAHGPLRGRRPAAAAVNTEWIREHVGQWIFGEHTHHTLHHRDTTYGKASERAGGAEEGGAERRGESICLLWP